MHMTYTTRNYTSTGDRASWAAERGWHAGPRGRAELPRAGWGPEKAEGGAAEAGQEHLGGAAAV